MSVIFDLQTLSNPSTFEDDAGVRVKQQLLFSGKNSVAASIETRFSPTFNCYTESYAEITALRAKIGYPGSLTVGTVTYTTCYIEKFKSMEYAPNKWRYTISFIQDTT